MDYRKHYQKPRINPQDSTDIPKCPPINIGIIEWLEYLYPLRRYPKDVIGNSGFPLIASCDEGRYEVIDRLRAEFMAQNSVQED